MTSDKKTELEACIRRHADMVYRLAYSYVRNRADAEDVFQDVFLRLVRKQPVFEDEEHCKAWLLHVTANCAKSLLHSAWRRHTQPLDDAILADAPPEEVHLDEALRQLKPVYRAVIHLHYFEGYKTDEIAEILGSRPSTVRSQLRRAREQLAVLLKEES